MNDDRNENGPGSVELNVALCGLRCGYNVGCNGVIVAAMFAAMGCVVALMVPSATHLML